MQEASQTQASDQLPLTNVQPPKWLTGHLIFPLKKASKLPRGKSDNLITMSPYHHYTSTYKQSRS